MEDHTTPISERNTQISRPTLGTVCDQVMSLAMDLRELALEHDDRRLARLATTAVGTIADIHFITEQLATIAGAPNLAGEVAA